MIGPSELVDEPGSLTPDESPIPGLSHGGKDELRKRSLPLLSAKRALSVETSQRIIRDNAAPPKRPKYEEKTTLATSENSILPISSPSSSPVVLPRDRSSLSLQFPSTGALETMLHGDDTSRSRTIKLARGSVGSASPARSSPKPPSRHTSEGDGVTPIRSLSQTNGLTGSQLLSSIHVTEFLQQDDRPTFIIDLADESNLSSNTLKLLFLNNALKTRPNLLAHVRGKSDDPTLMLDLITPFDKFKSWVLTQSSDTNTSGQYETTFQYASTTWKSFVVRKQLRVFSGQPNTLGQLDQGNRQRPALQHYKGLSSSSTGTLPNRNLESPGYFDIHSQGTRAETSVVLQSLVAESFPENSPDSHEGSPTASGDVTLSDLISTLDPPFEETTFPARNNAEGFESMSMGSYSDKGFFDWTRLPPSSALPAHIQFAHSVNWAATSLGPIETWCADLRGMCNLIMASPHPAAMYWGKDNVAIYNEAYILLAGQNHPRLMGMRYADAWSEIWSALEDVFENAHTSAQATMKDDDCLFLQRNGFLEETYFSWSLIPLIGEDGTVVGTYNPAFEKTRRKIAERRMLTLREIGERTAAARKVTQFWHFLLEGLEYNEFDAPLAMVYSLQDDSPDNETVSSTSSTVALARQCYLEGALGVPQGHAAAPHQIDLRTGIEGFGVAFRHALQKNKPIVLRAEDGTLDMQLFEGIKWRGYGDPSKVVIVAPIQPTTGESTLGFLVMATNPRRPYDEDYDLFVQLLGRQIATSVASVVLFEDEIKKGEEAAKMAAQDRIELSNQLAARTQEAMESENKFTRMAELAPVGIFIGDPKGSIIFCNDAWYDLSSFPRGRPVGNDWLLYVKEEDQERIWKSWETLLEQKVPVSVEFRFKTQWGDRAGNGGDVWVIAGAYPEKDDDGKIKMIFGSVTNISVQKFAEEQTTRRMEEAVEMKRQQTNFIDITSHEMRNPLGAILLSADEIIDTLTDVIHAGELTKQQSDALDSTVDAAQTITLCAQHQKRIVDDVLTLSKLDSAVLAVTPVDAQPLVVIQRALRIFEGELQSADIALDFRVDKSYYTSRVDWVRLDPFRLSQVLINLTTNAIKFTTTQEKRTIIVHLAASEEKPSQEDRYGLTYIPTRTLKTRDITASADWGPGEAVFIHFAVQDTGRGLTEEEKEKLFQRFSQANPRTHVTYGGSGLGLFICRELVELQGGEIGVASESGKGSTFAFYVKARRSDTQTGGSVTEHIDITHGRKSSSKSSKISVAKSTAVQALSQPSPRTNSMIVSSPSSKASPSPGPSFTPGALASDKLKILIVEDNLINQKVLASQLRKIGCVVNVANHGGEAIEHVQKSTFWHTNNPKSKNAPPDGIEISVVLMDLEMPVMDGMTCVRKIREMQRKGEVVGHIPIIAVTANAREEQIRNTIEAGMDDVVSKPFRVGELLAKVRELVGRFADGDYVGKTEKRG